MPVQLPTGLVLNVFVVHLKSKRPDYRTGDSEYDVAMRFAGLAEDMTPTLHPVLIAAYNAHLREAVGRDPLYSAAWKALGKALEKEKLSTQALEAFRHGIDAARRKGDKQAEKEMTVFARRLEKPPSTLPVT